MSVLERWPVINKVVSKSSISENTVIINECYVLKKSDDYFSLFREIRVIEELLKLGGYTPKIYETHGKKNIYQKNEHYYMLTSKLKGRHFIKKEVINNSEIVKNIGNNMAKLHKSLKIIEKESIFREFDTIATLEKIVIPELLNSVNLSSEWLSKYLKNFKELEPLPKQLIHRDIHLGNMIVKGESIRFIDYGISEINYRIFDICYFTTSVLNDIEENEIDKYFSILINLLKGYQDECSLEKNELVAIPYLIYAILLIAISYFSKREQYKELAEKNIKALQLIRKYNEKLFSLEF